MEVIILDWIETLYNWEKYAQKLYPLRDEVDDIFKTHYIWDAQCNCEERLYISDDDTVFLLKFSNMLNTILRLSEISYFVFGTQS